jgi:hypothetical protein
MVHAVTPRDARLRVFHATRQHTTEAIVKHQTLLVLAIHPQVLF